MLIAAFHTTYTIIHTFHYNSLPFRLNFFMENQKLKLKEDAIPTSFKMVRANIKPIKRGKDDTTKKQKEHIHEESYHLRTKCLAIFFFHTRKKVYKAIDNVTMKRKDSHIV